MKHVWRPFWQLANGVISVNVNDQAISGKPSSFCSAQNDSIPHRGPQRTHIALITSLLQILYNHIAAGNKQNQSLNAALRLPVLFSWPCARDCTVGHTSLPDPRIHAARNRDSHACTETHVRQHMQCTHTHHLPLTYMPTAARSGRVMEPVAMIETCLFKLEPCDMALSAGLHSDLTTPILISHTPPQTQPHITTSTAATSTTTSPHPYTSQPESFFALFTSSKPLLSYSLPQTLQSHSHPTLHFHPWGRAGARRGVERGRGRESAGGGGEKKKKKKKKKNSSPFLIKPRVSAPQPVHSPSHPSVNKQMQPAPQGRAMQSHRVKTSPAEGVEEPCRYTEMFWSRHIMKKKRKTATHTHAFIRRWHSSISVFSCFVDQRTMLLSELSFHSLLHPLSSLPALFSLHLTSLPV